MKSLKAKNNLFSFIVYDKDRSPRYYQFNKKVFQSAAIFIPLLFFLMLTVASGVLIYFQELRNITMEKRPEIIENLQAELSEAGEKIKELEDQSAVLQNRLSMAEERPKIKEDSSAQLLNSPFHFFRAVPGQENLTKARPLAIENPKYFVQNGRLYFKFDLVNQTPGAKRLSGYVHVLFKERAAFYFYPSSSENVERWRLLYSDGEPFATSRFRPVNAHFPLPSKKELTGLFKVMVFSRTGDILLQSTFRERLVF